MTDNNRLILNDVYQDMLSANRKAEEGLAKYNARIDEITKEETEKSKRNGLPEIFTAERVKSKKDSDEEARTYFSAYSFWKGELERYSALLQGICAYKTMTLKLPRDPARSSPINFSGQ